MKYLPWVLAILFAFLLGRDSSPPSVVTVTDTVVSQEYARRLGELRIEADGLRAKLAGIERRVPERVTVVDTLISPPDTVYRYVRVDDRGKLSIEVLGQRGGLYAPEIRHHINVSDCDDGWSVQDGDIVCNKPRLGHLFLAGRLGTDTAIGVYWEPTYRSGWRVGAYREIDRWTLNVEKGLRVF